MKNLSVIEELSSLSKTITDCSFVLQIMKRRNAPATAVAEIEEKKLKAERAREWLEKARYISRKEEELPRVDDPAYGDGRDFEE